MPYVLVMQAHLMREPDSASTTLSHLSVVARHPHDEGGGRREAGRLLLMVFAHTQRRTHTSIKC